jgi:hypothetical protein
MDILHDIRNRPGSALTARKGRDAKGTPVVAAILGFDKSPRAPVQAGQRRTSDRFHIKGLFRASKQIGDEGILTFIWDHTNDTREVRSLSRLEGGPATGNNDVVHSSPRGLTDLLARIGSSLTGYGAGVDNNQIRVTRLINDGMPACAELSRHSLNFRLIEAATDYIKKNIHRLIHPLGLDRHTSKD